MRSTMALLVGLTLLGSAAGATAQSTSTPPAASPTPAETRPPKSPPNVASVAATVVYLPFKTFVCAFGGAAGALGAIIDGARSLRVISGAACTGTWVITPEMLRSQEPINVIAEAADL